ncbi:MAG: T9SS type A sorting domain-containing protein [Bacteroidetes bacterium]|nr:T9SS type A sorting domain-containing protein [Bacteroidota bacterium]
MKDIVKFIFCFLFSASLNCESQSLFQRYYSGASDNFQSDIVALSDSGFLLARQAIENRSAFFQLIRLNQQGDTLWTKSDYDTILSTFYCIVPAGNGNYYIGGTFLPDSLPQYGVVAKINDSGNLLWKKEFKDSVTTIRQITLLKDGDLLLSSVFCKNPYSPRERNIRVDSLFNIKWAKNLGEYNTPAEVKEEINGNLLISSIRYGGGSSISFLDSNGNSTIGIYPTCYVYRSAFKKNAFWKNNDTLISILTYWPGLPNQNTQAEYILTEINQNGQPLPFKVINDSLFDFVTMIERLPNKNFVVCGKRIKNFFESEMVVVLLDSLYHTIWERSIHNYPIECAIATKVTQDNRIILLGSYDTYFHTLHGFSITAIDSTGNIIGIQNTYANNQQNWMVFPNPAVDEIQFQFLGEILQQDKLCLTIYNSIGQLVHTKEIQKLSSKVSTQKLNSGYYFFKIESISGKHFASGKFSVEK